MKTDKTKLLQDIEAMKENNMLITTNSFENIKTKLSIVGVSMAWGY